MQFGSTLRNMLDGSFDGANVNSYIAHIYLGTAGQFTVSKS